MDKNSDAVLCVHPQQDKEENGKIRLESMFWLKT